ncbi:PREDICTED: Hermansky-Pudlak syndrome 5 protein homolog [Ceratosolen solmsi marchali]|uniref:Hermansky-Pudlak syndrome 5 protein homolog n=1 Tax=Ceratosolen solmsi marchali TaxID=326594 RepID=A0AAJ6YMK7_9HYME|nr:PREDICTED: Hermansky-Pudlak syndrome 5 protein homolog [Ceratosolen solmsi marchali]
MQEIPFLLTEWQELNSLLYAPLNATKKIQYTCINVSENYIVLGATSGSLYLFAREPCIFQQLIPLSEGAVFRAQISPDEKMIALATVRGNICLVALKPSIKLITVSTEHLGEKVTCLCWNSNSTEVYAGDETGKASVTVLLTFMVNGIFQAPSCTLMNLDSKIVQMNFTSPLLLISTLNRCYICDTILEQYKQIGNKPRDGEFGACFLKTQNIDRDALMAKKREHVSNVKQVFSMNVEATNVVDQESLPKIYCARPGSRIWEVTATGIVIKTHQFKEALAIAPLPVYKPSIGKLLKLRKRNQTWPAHSINFAQLFVINHKYLFSYTPNGLYVFDPGNAEVILWNDEFPDTFMAHIINDKIYLMTSSNVFHCLTFESVDSLISKLYDRKFYKECLDICQTLRPQLMNSIAEESRNMDSKQTMDLSDKLRPIISLIKSHRNSRPIKLESGMVIVNSGNKNSKNELISNINKGYEHRQQNIDELENLFTSLNTNDTTRKSNLDCEDFKAENGLSEKIENNVKEEVKSNEVNSLQKTMCNVQADLESLYISMSSQMKSDITKEELGEVLQLFVNTLDSVKKKYEVSNELQSYLFEVIRSAELHYSNTLLDNLSVELLSTIDHQEILAHLVKIFIDINSSKYIECCCKFPYPIFGTGMNKSSEPKFHDIGKVLLDKILNESDNTCLQICNQIPYMWRYYLSFKGYTKQCLPDVLLKQCLQTRDNFILSIILPTLSKDQWKLTAQCFENIKNGRCVNCSKPYDNDHVSSKEFSIDWSGITNLIVKKQGPNKAMTFLLKMHENLPQIIFDKSIYQSIIFSTILKHHGVKHAIELDHSDVEFNSICSPEVLENVVNTIEKDLEEPISKELFGTGPHHWGMRYNIAALTCPCCTLSLQTPVLLGDNGIALFPCGHAYHVNCMIQKKISRCNLHSQ